MATFPGALKTWVALVDNTDGIVAAHPNERGDEIEVLEIKVGVTSSAVTTSHDYLLTHLPGQATDWDAGTVEIRAQTFEADTTSAIPLVLASGCLKCTYLDADLVDGKHVDGSNGAGEITTNDGTQTLTNKTLTSPDINGGSLDSVQIGGTTATGELIVNNATDDADGLGSQGTAGQALISAGAGSNPTWGSISGSSVQTVYTLNQTKAETAVTSVTSNDTDAFIITEGFETMTRTITGSSSNTVRIDVTVIVAGPANANIVAGLFNTDSHATNALAVSGFERIVDAHSQLTLHFTFFQALPSDSTTTYRVRVSSDSAISLTVNGGNNIAVLAQKMASTLIVTEIKA